MSLVSRDGGGHRAADADDRGGRGRGYRDHRHRHWRCLPRRCCRRRHGSGESIVGESGGAVEVEDARRRPKCALHAFVDDDGVLPPTADLTAKSGGAAGPARRSPTGGKWHRRGPRSLPRTPEMLEGLCPGPTSHGTEAAAPPEPPPPPANPPASRPNPAAAAARTRAADTGEAIVVIEAAVAPLPPPPPPPTPPLRLAPLKTAADTAAESADSRIENRPAPGYPQSALGYVAIAPLPAVGIWESGRNLYTRKPGPRCPCHRHRRRP